MSKISWFVSGKEINYSPKLKAMQIIDLQDADDTQWDDIAHEQTTICRKFFLYK